MKVPFLDLRARHRPMREEILRAVGSVIDSGAFAGGPFVERFETDFAAYCGTRFAIGVGTGTDALGLALVAAGVGRGDEVITVPMSFIATAEAISFCGAKPVFVDIDPQTYTMDPSALESVLTDRTRAILPVHLFGQTADMTPILEFAEKHGLQVIEDAAHAHGAEYKGRKAGSLADAGCFSFYPGKNLGAIGEGGAVVTDDEELADKVRALRDHGQFQKYHHRIIGWNSRMDGIQAAVLSIKLRQLDDGNRLRRRHAACYDAALRHFEGIELPAQSSESVHARHIYALQVSERSELIRIFDENGIGYGIHYPVPIHLQEAYAGLRHRKGEFPVSERCADRFISLPLFPELSHRQIEAVVHAVGLAAHAPLPA